MYSPVPIENAPATSAATPVSTTAWDDSPPPPTPAISDALVTSPSTAPNTVGRSHPPETSRCRCDQPCRSAAAPVAWDGSRASSSATAELSLSTITSYPTIDGPAGFRRRRTVPPPGVATRPDAGPKLKVTVGKLPATPDIGCASLVR